MNTHPTRTFVLHILKLVVWIIIAVALVKFAFFPPQNETSSITGQGNFTLPTVTVDRGDIENTQKFDGTIMRNEASTIKANAEGTINYAFVADGATVKKGDRIVQIRSESMDTLSQVSEDSEAIAEPIVKYTDVLSPASGTVHLEAMVGQSASIGDALGSIEQNSFHVVVPLTPDQLYTLQGIPNEAEVLITNGPAPFKCTNLHTDAVTRVSTASDNGEDASSSSSPELRCGIPAEQTVFDGLKAKLTITGQSATDVLVAPATAVEGRYREGNVYIPNEDPTGKPKAVKVGIGITDGEWVEITSGIDEGAEILEFVPSLEDEDENSDDSMDEMGG